MADITESQIDAVIKKAGGNVRAVARAYLRAAHRAHSAEVAFNVMDNLNQAKEALKYGKYRSASDFIDGE